jgi:uncharacterized membrane protein YczE
MQVEAGEKDAVSRRRALVERTLCFCLGLLVNSVGITLITRSGLGTSQISSLPYVWSLADPRLSFALTTFVVNMAFVVVQAVLLGRSFFPLQLLQVVANVLFSSFLGVAMAALSWFHPQSLPLQALGVAAGCVTLGTGVAIECAPDLIFVPGEGLVHALAQVTGARLGTSKLAFDAVLVASATILSLALFGRLEGVGAGTVVTIFVTGNVVNFMDAHLPLVAQMRALAHGE